MNKTIILSDFDGTITLNDVNEELFKTYGGEKAREIERDYRNAKIGDRENLIKQYQRIHLSKNDFFNFLDRKIKVDEYFYNFYRMIKEQKLPFAIISGGFKEYIEYLLAKEKIIFDDEIYANTLCFDEDKLIPHFKHNISTCHQAFGVCGNCKYQVVVKLKKLYDNIIYIGDGLTDRCVVEEVNYIFAKKDRELEKFCINKRLSYTSYKNFNDIMYRITGILNDINTRDENVKYGGFY